MKCEIMNKIIETKIAIKKAGLLKFKELIPKDLTVYGHDYVAVDLNESIKGDYSHVRYR